MTARPTPTAERFGTMMPVYDTLADVPKALAAAEHDFLLRWSEEVRRAGGEPIEAPYEIERVNNVHYGQPLTGPDGELVLGCDGEPLIDRVKLYLGAVGWAERTAS